MSTVTIRNLKKSFGAAEVIHGVDLDIADGEFVVLVGPSGCGKSTLLRMVAGLETISGGSIAIDDRVVNDLAPKDRDIAMVFQNYALYPQMTVAQNMGFSLEMAGLKKPQIEAKVKEVAAVLDLEPLLDRKPASLSGGQRQRVAMGRAIVRDPKVFLFDEPLSNLDAKLRVQMRAEIKALHERLGTTIIYVTHDQVEAMTMADKIVVLHGGRIEQVGKPLELYDKPANDFVAGFIGSPAMNFFDGTAEKDGVRLKTGALVPTPKAAALAVGSNVRIGFRPEVAVIDASGTITGTVTLVEPTGSDTVIAMNVGDEPATLVVHHRVDADKGDELKLTVDPANIHLFSAETGQVI